MRSKRSYGARKSLANSKHDASFCVFQGSSQQRERKVPQHWLPSMPYPRIYLVLENKAGPLQEPSEVSSRETPSPSWTHLLRKCCYFHKAPEDTAQLLNQRKHTPVCVFFERKTSSSQSESSVFNTLPYYYTQHCFQIDDVT